MTTDKREAALDPLTPEERERLKAACAAATPGPWQARFLYRIWKRVRESPGDLHIQGHPGQDWPDCVFIEAARDALPLLLQQLEEMERKDTTAREQWAADVPTYERHIDEKDAHIYDLVTKLGETQGQLETLKRELKDEARLLRDKLQLVQVLFEEKQAAVARAEQAEAKIQRTLRAVSYEKGIAELREPVGAPVAPE